MIEGNQLRIHGDRAVPELMTLRRRVFGAGNLGPEHGRPESVRERGTLGQRLALLPPSLTSPGCSDGDESGQDFGGPNGAGKLKT